LPHINTPTQTIGAILKRNPKALSVLQQYGLGCAGCPLNTMETLEEGAKAHGLAPKEITTLIEKLSQ
jgi:hybrid cluster-associated redox disulfide protein